MKLKKTRGFTLIEVIISLVILGILAGGVFATISFSKLMSIRTQEKAIAIGIVEAKMNALKESGVPNLPPDCDQTLNNCQPEEVTLGQWGGAPLTGTLTTEVKDTVPADPLKMKEVKVTLQWADRFGQDRTVSVVTAMYQE